ncbi:MAG: hypothetical protein COA67_10410 [Lutibacter sp.]|nr:MAG: hypothetical protein COA67_10410 [Lutibacter sp.]
MKFKTIGLLFVGMMIAILYFYFNPSVTFFPKCPLYTTTGIYCPGCGSQRAFHDLLHLDFKGVIGHNLLFLFGLSILIYHLTVNFLNTFYNKGIKNILYHKKAPILILVLIIIFWILRNIPLYPFTLLAPN